MSIVGGTVAANNAIDFISISPTPDTHRMLCSIPPTAMFACRDHAANTQQMFRNP
ncbi:hypothetical protein MCC02031_18630 [Bifidobacteriaceae bacterium MCC02031]|nr:hypothetical protein MCC02031_18630 [Bifidobacteriaceae bacterium MCC02031]